MCSGCARKAALRNGSFERTIREKRVFVPEDCPFSISDIQSLLERKREEQDFQAVSILISALNTFERDCFMFEDYIKTYF
jgi:hypothetical protein